MSLLIAESGATKTDWVLLKKTGKPVFFRTPGISPYFQTVDEIVETIKKELLWNKSLQKLEAIAYYGTGSSSHEKQGYIKQALKKAFNVTKIDVQSDTMASARGLCGDKKGIICILGTGSNSGYYDGKKLRQHTVSLGYLAGDEGSGNHMGKRVLQYYAYNTFDLELRTAFEKLFGNDLDNLVRQLYDVTYPNRMLASFVELLIQNRGHFMVENIIEDCLNDFFHCHVLKYRESWKLPLNFTGSVASGFQDVLANLCEQYELQLGAVAKTPIDGLIKYHKHLL